MSYMSYDRDRAWVDNISGAIQNISVCIALEMRDQRQSKEKARDEGWVDQVLAAEEQLQADREVRINVLKSVRESLEGLY